MPTLARIGVVQIRMFADDHNPPHFHVWTADSEALVLIKDLAVSRGRIRQQDLELALEWASRNMDLLLTEWNRLNG